MTSGQFAAPSLGLQNEFVSVLGDTHSAMIGAVLNGGGLERVAALAADAVGGPVAIIVPSHRVALAARGPRGPVELDALRAWVGERLDGRPSVVPVDVVAESQIHLRDQIVGVVALLRGDGPPRPHTSEFLRLAVAATQVQLAIEDTRAETEANLRGSLLEELRSCPDLDGGEIVRRAARLGCDLAHGALLLCAELTVDRPRVVLATIEAEWPGALAQELAGVGADGGRRLYAALPVSRAGATPESTAARARKLAARLGPYGAVGISSFYPGPADLGRALREAEFMLEVNQRGGAPLADHLAGSTYRLLFRMLATEPQEVRDFYGGTVAGIVTYDEQNRTELVRTLSTYLSENCNMNATATALFAHRHTIAYRLERIRELTGLDPTVCHDRESLGLGLKVLRLLAAQGGRAGGPT